MAIATINPTSGETVRTFRALSDHEVRDRISLAHQRWSTYRRTSLGERAAVLRACADILEKEAEEAAWLKTVEMGKTIASARSEALKCVHGMRFYADNAVRFLADESLDDPSTVGARRAMARYESLGVVLAVMPWNFRCGR